MRLEEDVSWEETGTSWDFLWRHRFGQQRAPLPLTGGARLEIWDTKDVCSEYFPGCDLASGSWLLVAYSPRPVTEALLVESSM